MYCYQQPPRFCAKFQGTPLDKPEVACYYMRNGRGNPSRSGGRRRQGRHLHWKNHSFSPFGANGPGLPGRVLLRVVNPFAPFSCLDKRGKGN